MCFRHMFPWKETTPLSEKKCVKNSKKICRLKKMYYLCIRNQETLGSLAQLV